MSETVAPTSDRRAVVRAAAGLAALAAGAALAPLPARAGDGRKLAKFARKFVGDRYVLGGESPGGFDCSGLTWYAAKKVLDKDIGRTVEDQYNHGRKVDKKQLKAGDLVFFRNTAGKGLTHVGICLDGEQFVHAQNEETGVIVTPLSNDYYQKHYAGARRIA